MDVNDGNAGLPACPYQEGNALLEAGVVAAAPRQVIEAALHVDDDQRGLPIQWFQFVPGCVLRLAWTVPTPEGTSKMAIGLSDFPMGQR